MFRILASPHLILWPISEKDCSDIISELNPNNPTGPSKVPAWVIIDSEQYKLYT